MLLSKTLTGAMGWWTRQSSTGTRWWLCAGLYVQRSDHWSCAEPPVPTASAAVGAVGVVMGGLEGSEPHSLDRPFANNSAAVAVVGQRLAAVAWVLGQVPALTPLAAQAATLGEGQRARSCAPTETPGNRQAVQKTWARAYRPGTSRGPTGGSVRRWIVGMVAGVGEETPEEGGLPPVQVVGLVGLAGVVVGTAVEARDGHETQGQVAAWGKTRYLGRRLDRGVLWGSIDESRTATSMVEHAWCVPHKEVGL